MERILEILASPKISLTTDEATVAYLHWSHKIAEISALVERDILILSICGVLGINVTNEELQTAGNAFRLRYKLLNASKTFAWLNQQRITAEDWSQGIRVSLLTQKLKEYLFNEVLETHSLINRGDYQRVALSQILVHDLTEAWRIVQELQEKNSSFCALALEHSKGKQSRENGGFTGIRFLADLLPEIARAVTGAKECQVIGPIQTELGYHILRIEKWLPVERSEVREQILEALFQNWLQGISCFVFDAELHE